jgi:ABC-type uncharacterized transport system permease subunit
MGMLAKKTRGVFRRALRVSVLPLLEAPEEALMGGQAVIEGVMMRSPHSYAVAVRQPSGSIAVKRDYLERPSERHAWLKYPLLRGLATLGQALALGKALSGGVRALSQAVIVYLLALVLGVKMNWNPLALVGVLVAVILAAAAFSAFSLTIAFIVRTRERFMGIGQVLTMPFFFASNAIYPIAIMPGWLQVAAHANPLTYEVDALRSLMLANSTSSYGLATDYAVLLAATIVLVTAAARLYPRAAT